MSYLGTLNSLLSTTTSRYNSLRRTLLSSSSEEADKTIDDPDSSHVSHVLRAYYTEKGRPFPPWLPPDPHARPSASPQASFIGSAGSLRGAGRNPGSGGPAASAGGRGGGLSDLWADSSNAQQPQQDSGSLRRGLAGARIGRNRTQEPQQGQSESLAPRPLPSQRAGSYQNAMGQPQGGGSGPYGGRSMSPQPPGSAGSGSGSVQERLKARLGGRGAVTPPLPREGSGGSMGGYDGAGGSYGKTGEGNYGSSGGANPYASGGYGSGDPYAGGGGGGYDSNVATRRKPPPGQATTGLPSVLSAVTVAPVAERTEHAFSKGGITSFVRGKMDPPLPLSALVLGATNDTPDIYRPLSFSVFVMFQLLRFLFLFVCVYISNAQQEVLSDSAKRSNETLLWGPYRPNLYFGVRPRIPKSLTTGLLWARTDSFETVQHNFRHTCEQHEGMAGYGWDEYDVRHGGRQTIHDAGNSIDITTEFAKIPGGHNGGSWGVRIKGMPREDAPVRQFTTVVFYAAMEGFGNLRVDNEQDDLGIEGPVTMSGNTNELGDFTLEVTEGPDTNKHPPPAHKSYADKPLDRTFVASLQASDDTVWQAKALLFTSLKVQIDKMIAEYGAEHAPPPWQTFTIPNDIKEGNLHLVQKVFEGEFEFDVIYSSSSAGPITSRTLTDAIDTATESFSERFTALLAPKAPFDKPKYQPFARSMFSNLIGGIGYFYGDAVVDRSYAPEYEEENEGFWEETAEARSRVDSVKLEGPSELYTSIPSRPFFPRGFLWDEGFHLIPVADWDMDLTLEIIQSWFNLVDEDGWIGREQILGQEARSKVPQEFQVQYPHYANPPTLFLIFESLVDKLESQLPLKETSDPLEAIRSAHLKDKSKATAYLRTLYPLIKRHYFWYRKTQRGDVTSYDREAFSSKEAYRWRGRTPSHILTSGLDDYPRPQPPHPGELHVDLISWMGMMTRSMRRIATYISEPEDAREFEGYENAIVRNIDDLHWDSKEQTYCDATIDDYEESVHVCHKGYVSIFPFLTGLVPADSPRLGAILDSISDEETLWSPFGLRSLSKADPNYGTKEDYWRSPIWMNINYLAVKALLDVAQTPGPHKAQATKLYTNLRKNLVENVFDNWERTGFAWEQYNAETGEGQRTQHFTGWTSLVVKIMNMPDLSKAGIRDEL